MTFKLTGEFIKRASVTTIAQTCHRKTPLYYADSETSACVGWTGNNELFSCGDDRKILRWSGDGEFLGPVPAAIFDAPPISSQSKSQQQQQQQQPESHQGATPTFFVTDLQWFPATPGKGQGTSDIYVAGGTDGRFYLCSKGGRIEKVVEAHKGAVLALKWNYEGSALVTAGEDGQAKIWSRSGMLRSVLVSAGYPIYSIVWAPDDDQLLYTNGRNLVIKAIQPATKPNQWKAHDGVILKVDWNFVSNLIVSGGEDRKYKVWDSFGRQLFSSAPHDHPITSVAWNPSGEMFAVGLFNALRVCDKLGWSYAVANPESGSVFSIAWTPDGTQVACGCGDGSVLFAHIIDRRMEWKNYEVTLADDRRVQVHDVVHGAKEHLEFRDRIVNVSLGFNHLIVATSLQCYVYSDKNWNTPAIIDLDKGGRVICIKQCAEYFAIVDNFTGINIHTYEGRAISRPKYPGLRPEFITPATLSLSTDVIAIKDRSDESSIFVFEVTTGRQIGDGPIKIPADALEIALNQTASPMGGRQLVAVDKNRDMFITPVFKPLPKKLGTMVETFAWNEETDMIAAMVDGKFVVWYLPNVVFIDEDIEPLTRFSKEGSQFGKNAQFVNFTGTQCTLRRADGALVTVNNISPLPALLQEVARRKHWEEAIRICRHSKMNELWACLAAMSLAGQDLNTAELAYAAIDEIQKVQYICHVREIPTTEGRSAELALLRRNPKEAEAILLGAGLVYRAIRMWIDQFNWDRALELAVKHKTHVDTVLYFRDRYLRKMNRRETIKQFIQYSQSVTVDPEKIRAKMQMEEEGERSKPSAKPYKA